MRYEPIQDPDGPEGSIVMHWGDPEWEAGLRAEIEAECAAEDPDYEPYSDEDWEALLKVFGV